MAAGATQWAKQVVARVEQEPGWRVEVDGMDHATAYAPDGKTIVRILDSNKDFRWRRNTLSELRKAGLDLYAEFKSESTRPKRERRAAAEKAAPAPRKRAPQPQPLPVPSAAELPLSARDWYLTDHAAERAEERGIGLEEILAVIGAPTLTRPADNDSGRMLYQRGDLAVVAEEAARRIITVLPPNRRPTKKDVADAVAAADAQPAKTVPAAQVARRDEPGEWTPGAVRQFAARLSDAFLLCREIGHQWKPWQASWNASERHFERALKCGRCKTQRWETLTRTGRKTSTSYVHPEGYLSKGHGRLTGDFRDTLRLESITRLVEQSTSQSA